MYDFKINLLSNDPLKISESEAIIHHQTTQILRSLKKRAKKDLQIRKLRINIYTDKFWAVWKYLDGTSKESAQQIAEKQRNSLKKFSKEEIQQIMKITLNKALILPYIDNQKDIKYHLGHTIFFNEICKKETSLFENIISENFMKRIYNGMFWENILLTYVDQDIGNKYNSKTIIDSILLNHQEKLDPEFASEGYLIMERIQINKFKKLQPWLDYPDVDLDELNQTTQEKYIQFIEDIYNHKEEILDIEDIGNLVSKYLETKLLYLGDYESLYKNPLENNPFLKKIIEKSDVLRRQIGNIINLELKTKINGPIFNLFKEFPYNNEIMKYALNYTSSKEVSANYIAEETKYIKAENISTKEFKNHELN